MAKEADWEFGHDLKFRFVLEPERTALVIVDMQYASACRSTGVGKYLADRGHGHLLDWRFTRIEKVVLPNLQRLLAVFRERRLRVLYLTIGAQLEDFADLPESLRPFGRAAGNRIGLPANEILEELRPRPGEIVVRKTTQSAFMSSSLAAVLQALGVRYLCFAGVSTYGCVSGTARDAADLNYRSVMVEDCCAATREDLHVAAFQSFAAETGRVMSTDEVIGELGTR